MGLAALAPPERLLFTQKRLLTISARNAITSADYQPTPPVVVGAVCENAVKNETDNARFR
jgi:hypothetical protein